MNVHAIAALELALRLYRAPQLAQAMRNDPLPAAGIDVVIRCASGEEAALVEASAQLTTSREVLREAAAFYLTQTLFTRDADAWRVLGVRPGDSQDVLRAHFRLLVHWLATSRNRDPLYALYGDRVQRAWTELRRSPEEIAARAQRRPPPAIVPPRTERLRQDVERYGAGLLRALRALPTWIVGIVAGVLLLILLAAYWVTQTRGPPPSLVANGAAVPTVVMTAPTRSGTVVMPVVPRPVRPMPSRLAPSAVVPTAAAPAPVARPLPPAASGRIPVPGATGTVAAAYDPAAAASATATLAMAAATAAARQPVSTSPPASPSSAIVSPAGAAAMPSSAAPLAIVNAATAAAPAATVRAGVAAAAAPVTSAPAAPAPAAVTAVTAVPAAPTPAIVAATSISAAPPAAVRALLQRFVSTYESADLRDFMTLFAPDARENRGGLAAIREDYGQLFAGSDLRRLQLYDVRIVPAAYGMLDVRVRYQAGVLMHGSPAMAHYSGDMRLVLRPDPSGLRIIQLLRSGEAEGKPGTPR